MFARVAIYDVPQDRMADAVARFEGAVRQIEELDGLAGAYVLVDADGDRALTMTLWASRPAMDHSRPAASRLRAEAAGSEGGVLSVEEFEVALQRLK